MKEFSEAQLAQYKGEDGQPTYIAYQGKVYDVSGSKMWRGGQHMKRHPAGRDLTADLQAAPHTAEVLERYPQVGVLVKEAVPEQAVPAWLEKLLERYPMLRRHPHPMTVHFPIVFMISTTIFNLLYLLTGIKSFETTALHCLGGGILFTVVAVTTGWFTWWLNYLAQPMRPVSIKKRYSLIMLALALIAFIWRLSNPHLLDKIQGPSVIYLAIVLSFFPLVSVIGWHGAHLTFPTENE